MSPRKAIFEIPSSPNLDIELSLGLDEPILIAGVDEAGRGAWAGPVFAGAAILDVGTKALEIWHGVRDSKQMSVKERELWAGRIKQGAVAWGIGSADCGEIDRFGIVAATRLAMARAVEQLAVIPRHLLIDALRLPGLDIPQSALIKGDRRSLSIAAASVLAKTARDTWMHDSERLYPQYGFARHKGYGTRLHQATLAEYGPSPIHRKSFRPLKLLNGLQESASGKLL